jgi:prolyl-tRNA editing enzyme YbaK/EbsC (Cys-tRNA(Pro) deacylase)
MDADLLQFSQVWASAGVENILMALNPTALQTLTHARAAQIKQEKV